MKRLIVGVVFLAGLLLPVMAQAGTVTLEWGAVDDANLEGYKVYYSNTNVQPFQGTGADVGDSGFTVPKGTNTATMKNLDISKTYYFAVTAYNTQGGESVYSNIVSVTGPWFPSVPVNLKVKSLIIGPESVTIGQ